ATVPAEPHIPLGVFVAIRAGDAATARWQWAMSRDIAPLQTRLDQPRHGRLFAEVERPSQGFAFGLLEPVPGGQNGMQVSNDFEGPDDAGRELLRAFWACLPCCACPTGLGPQELAQLLLPPAQKVGLAQPTYSCSIPPAV